MLESGLEPDQERELWPKLELEFKKTGLKKYGPFPASFWDLFSLFHGTLLAYS